MVARLKLSCGAAQGPNKDMIRCGEFRFPHPIFFHVRCHPYPVPGDIWRVLRDNNAIITEVEFT